MIIFNYPSKKELTANVGKPLKYIETSLFGAEYIPNGSITGANRTSYYGPRERILCHCHYGKRINQGG
jgi:hypothetical protein